MKFILGSSSPRRLELLSILGIKPDEIISPNIDETINKKELPLDYCKRIATQKMKHFEGKYENAVILTADTIAYSGRRIIDKTNDEVIARKNLNKLSGRRHRVSTVLCLRDTKNKVISRSVTTTVNFKLLNKKDIDNYIKTNEWKNVAGSYKIQGYAEVFIKSINGSYSNVVGLPLFQTNNLLGSVGLIKS